MPLSSRPMGLTAGALLLSFALAGPAGADACDQPVTGVGRAANPLNYDPPKHYNMEKLAKGRAIAKWRTAVALKCAARSSLWWRAGNKKIACEGYAGGLGCEVTGTPGPRFWR